MLNFNTSRKIKSLIFVFGIFSISCSFESTLPKEVPNELEITYVDKLDDRNYFHRIEIKNDDITIFYDKEKRSPDTIKLKLTKKQKESIYKGFIVEKFDLINSAQIEKSANGKYREISFQANDFSKIVRFGDNYQLSEKDKKRFNTLWVHIDEFEVECCPPNKK